MSVLTTWVQQPAVYSDTFKTNDQGSAGLICEAIWRRRSKLPLVQVMVYRQSDANVLNES